MDERNGNFNKSLVHFDSCNCSANWNHDFIHDWPHMCILLFTFSSWNLVRCSSRPFEGKPTRQTPCPIRPQCYTALCGQSVPENPGAFSFWIFWGDWKGKNAARWLVWIGDLFRGTSRGDSSRGIGFNWTFEQQKPFEKVFVSLILREKCEK